MTAKPKLMIVDGHSLAFRAFYGVPVERFQNTQGQHTNAIYGFLAMLLNMLEKYQPESLAIAFDKSRHSFRTQEYPEYKATRQAAPPEFHGQVPLLQEALAAMNIVTLQLEGFEADDIIATLATRGAECGNHVLVVSGDRDTIQLVTEDVTLLYPASQGVREMKEYTPEAVREKYGVMPDEYRTIAALVGESSDNLPGVPKVGPKTAAKWVNQYGKLPEIIAHSQQITGAVGQSLRDHVAEAERNYRLNQLVRDVKLPVEVAQLRRAEINVDEVKRVFAHLNFRSMLTRVLEFSLGKEAARVAVSRPVTEKPSTAFTAPQPSATMQQLTDPIKLGFTPYSPSLLTADSITDFLESTEKCAVYVGESAQPGCYSVGLARQDGCAEFEWRPNTPEHMHFQTWLASAAAKILWDAKSVIRLLADKQIQVQGIGGDAQLALALLRPDLNEKVLSAAAAKYLDQHFKDADFSQLVPDMTDVAGAAERAWAVYWLHEFALANLHAAGKQLYSEVELPLVPTLAALEIRGVAINLKELQSQLSQLREQITQIESEAFALIGHEVNLASPKQLQKVLFEQLQLQPGRKIKSGYSTDAATLHKLYEESGHPFLEKLLTHRESVKLAQIIQSLIDAVGSDGRIHTSLGQIGAATGRLSSNNPNLQNIPVRSAEGNRIRAAFTHGADYEALFTADYSQIEMRVMAHMSGDDALIAAFNEGEDLHRSVGARVFGVNASEVTPQMRSRVKAMSYGLAYGLGPFGLAKQLGITQREAKQLMQDYFKRFGAIRDLLRDIVEDAREAGYTETVFGRRRPFPDLLSPNRVLRANAERAALNAPIQGTAADIIKIAMQRIEQRISGSGMRSRMVLQIHDELMFECAAGEREQLEALVREEMANAANLRVKLEVSVGYGVDWKQAGH